jgi:hypothetical protein
MTIFFRNAYLNWLSFLALIIATWALNKYMGDDPNFHTLSITVVIALSSILIAFINANAIGSKKDHEKMATKEELKLVVDQLKQHIASNDSSYESLFDLSKRNEEKSDRIIDLLLSMKVNSNNKK